MDRKRFLRTAGLGWGAAWLAGCAREGGESAGDGGDPPLGAGDGGAGTAAGLNPPLERIGVQLYTVRSLMADDVAGTLDAVAAIGYEEVEFAGYFGHEPAQIRAWLDAAGLAPVPSGTLVPAPALAQRDLDVRERRVHAESTPRAEPLRDSVRHLAFRHASHAR